MKLLEVISGLNDIDLCKNRINYMNIHKPEDTVEIKFISFIANE